MRKLLDGVVVAVTRLLVSIFFRRVEIVGSARVPESGPVIVVANHVNSLVDPLLLIAALPRRLRFLAKSTLWDNPLLRPLLNLAAAVPVYRRQDEGVDLTKNLETFAKSHELLAQAGALALFPEGISHSLPELAPLKTGAARIALEAEERFGPLGVQILPVGLSFEAKAEFRSRALVVVGEAIDVKRDPASVEAEPGEQARRLTRRIDAALRAVTVNYDSWDQAALIGRAAELFGRRELAMPGRRQLAESVALEQALIEGYDELAARHPAETREAATAVARYDRLLRAARLRDDQVAARYPTSSVVRYVLVRLLVLLPLLPFAFVGTVLNYLPYWLAGRVSRWIGEKPDVVSTYKLFPSLLLFPLTWAAEAFTAARLLGPSAGWLVAAAAPVLGWIAMRFHDRRQSFLQEARAYLLLRTREGAAEELAELRGRAWAAIERLMTVQLSQPSQPGRGGE
jgi:glycerol-3-phosphate O-acyltransferase / dihydroxyacetone phosphate acyltransferase